MITLIVTVILGLGFAIFATQNTNVVTLNFGQFYIPDVPLYLVVLTPLLVGLLASFIIYVSRDLSARLTESDMKKGLKKLRTENAELTKMVHKLELVNTKLNATNGRGFDEDSIQ